MSRLWLLSLLPSLLSCLQSDDQCYNVTCQALSYPQCVITSENDKTITLNSIYCNNGKNLTLTILSLDKMMQCKVNKQRSGQCVRIN